MELKHILNNNKKTKQKKNPTNKTKSLRMWPFTNITVSKNGGGGTEAVTGKSENLYKNCCQSGFPIGIILI